MSLQPISPLLWGSAAVAQVALSFFVYQGGLSGIMPLFSSAIAVWVALQVKFPHWHEELYSRVALRIATWNETRAAGEETQEAMAHRSISQIDPPGASDRASPLAPRRLFQLQESPIIDTVSSSDEETASVFTRVTHTGPLEARRKTESPIPPPTILEVATPASSGAKAAVTPSYSGGAASAFSTMYGGLTWGSSAPNLAKTRLSRVESS